jgi:hypothetical protein
VIAWNTAHVDIKGDSTDQTLNAKTAIVSSSRLLAINEEIRYEDGIAIQRRFGFESRSIDKASYTT